MLLRAITFRRDGFSRISERKIEWSEFQRSSSKSCSSYRTRFALYSEYMKTFQPSSSLKRCKCRLTLSWSKTALFLLINSRKFISMSRFNRFRIAVKLRSEVNLLLRLQDHIMYNSSLNWDWYLFAHIQPSYTMIVFRPILIFTSPVIVLFILYKQQFTTENAVQCIYDGSFICYAFVSKK